MAESMFLKRDTICMIQMNRQRGVFYGDNPFLFAAPTLFAQLSLSSILVAILQYFLTPLGQTSFVSQMLGGFILGPKALGAHMGFAKIIFPEGSLYVCRTLSLFAVVMFLFLIGVRTNIGMVLKSGKKALVIGLCAFFVPLLCNIGLAEILRNFVKLDPHLNQSILYVASLQSVSSFYVTSCLLTDLKLLNSELGRLAMSSSLVCGTCSWTWTLIVFSVRKASMAGDGNIFLWMMLAAAGMAIAIVCGMRPIILWMIRQMPEGRVVKEGYVLAVFHMLLGCSLTGEYAGQNFLFGPMILGIAIPDGPPLGSALVDKLESLVRGVLMPLYFVLSADTVILSSLNFQYLGIVELIALFGFMGKLIGTIFASTYCKMPLVDALSLGLIMSSQGITDVLLLSHAVHLKMIDEESYSLLVITMMLITGTITPIVKLLYKPSDRYVSYSRRTVQHSRPDTELRVITCIYNQENAPSLINLLELSSPTYESPICVYALHLVELAGRAFTLLVAHNGGTSKSTQYSDRIVKAFKLYESRRRGVIWVNPFTAIAPFVTIHDDVCTLALDKRASIIILPFHKQWIMSGTGGSANSIRAVNRNILRKAPCSVGVLIDRGTLGGISTNCTMKMEQRAVFNVVMIFLGGQDDREALAYGMRMADHPDVALTLVRLLESDWKSKYSVDKSLDTSIINEFRMSKRKGKRHIYKEEVIKDCVEMVSLIRSIENTFDLILVGRRHPSDSKLFMGLTDWNEFPELGLMGDMLVSSDSSCGASVLVMQQQTFIGEETLDSPTKYNPKPAAKDPFAMVDMPPPDPKLRPIFHV